MREFQVERRRRRFIYSKLSLVILLLITVALGKAVWTLYGKVSETKKLRILAETTQSDLRDREDFLKREVARLETPYGLEGEIRNNFNVGKEGERIAVVVGGEGGDSSATASTSVWGWIKGLFK